MSLFQNNRRILVIDDNLTIHEDFRKILTMETAAAAALNEAEGALFGEPKAGPRPDFRLDTAVQGEEGVALVKKAVEEDQPYAVAFVDVRMPPGMDGIETSRRIWQIDPDIQIVICTAFSEYSWEKMIEKLGMSDQLLILKKPFDNIEVLQLANSLTEKWGLLQERKNQVAELERKVAERTRELEDEIREREQAEELARKSQTQALSQERLAVVGQLAAGMAHEFNNLLTVIQGHSSVLLEDGSLPRHVTEALHFMAESSERGAQLIRQMLAFSRKQVLQAKVHDVDAVLQDFRQMLSRVLGESISLSIQRIGPPAKVEMDQGLIQQALINLALNARDAMPSGGELTVRLESVVLTEADAAAIPEARAGAFACLSFVDTGCGMDADTLKSAFEPFFTTKEVGKGTGLGLASVYGVVKQHQGWIDLSSEPGKGTTFRIFLPVSEKAAPETVRPENANRAGPRGSEKILVVEDEPKLRQLVVMILRRYGYEVVEAESGVHALEVYEKEATRIDLLLTDIVMPGGISGNDLADRLRSMQPDMLVIKSSGYSEETLRHQLLSGKDGFLAKPYEPLQMVRMVRELLDTAAPAAGQPSAAGGATGG